MAALDLASYVYVCYDGEDLFHERLILSWVDGGEYVVLTPDSDVFIEQLDAGNADLFGIRFGDALGSVPHGLIGHQVYSFANRPAGAALQNLLREGEVHARTGRLARGFIGLAPGAMPVPGAALPPVVVPLALPAPPAAPPLVPGAVAPPPPPPPLPPRLARAGGTWVLDEPVGMFTVGQEVPLPAGSLMFGTRGLRHHRGQGHLHLPGREWVRSGRLGERPPGRFPQGRWSGLQPAGGRPCPHLG